MTSTPVILTIPLDEYQQTLNNYTSILEKTNSQLGLWTNPYGVMVGILTLILGIATIGITLIIWRSSKEQRERAQVFFQEHEKLIKERFDKEDKEATVRRKEAKIAFETLIKEQKERLAKTSEAGKKEIEEAILNLEAQKINNDTYIGYNPASTMGVFATTATSGASLSPWSFNSRQVYCNICGKNFNVSNSGFTLLTTQKTVFCTHCGSQNYI